MPSLKQRDGGSYTARIKIPADVRELYAKQFGQRWSVKESWPKTLSPTEANRRCSEWIEQVNARFEALRSANSGNLQTLDHREAHALVGQWYREFVDKYENRPADPDDYQRLLDEVSDAMQDAAGFDDNRSLDALLADTAILAAIREDVAEATKADAWLMDHGRALTPESRGRFLDALALRYTDALGLLFKRAKGDFSRDPIRETFPTLEPAKAKGDKVSIGALFRQWAKEKNAAAGTVRRWGPCIDEAEKQWPDFRKVTESDARQWLKSLVTEDRSAGTVNGIWRTSLKTICNFGIAEGQLTANPFTGVRLTTERKTVTRETTAFTDDEVKTILKAASAVAVRTPLDAAKRWLPWLQAYSGARAGEVAQLRSQDIQDRNGTWVMFLTPEAGTMKTRKPRTVPLHEHIIDQGFLEYVKSRGKGPLFYDPKPTDEDRKTTPYGQVVRKVGEWVRTLGIDDFEIRPNHGWRHRFKLVAERAGIPERLSDFITGHKNKSIGRSYGTPELSDLAREMAKFPRYSFWWRS